MGVVVRVSVSVVQDRIIRRLPFVSISHAAIRIQADCEPPHDAEKEEPSHRGPVYGWLILLGKNYYAARKPHSNLTVEQSRHREPIHDRQNDCTPDEMLWLYSFVFCHRIFFLPQLSYMSTGPLHSCCQFRSLKQPLFHRYVDPSAGRSQVSSVPFPALRLCGVFAVSICV